MAATLPPPASSSWTSRVAPFAIAAAVVIGALGVIGVVGAKSAAASGDGSLVVTVAGPGNATVSGVEIYVDGTKKCDTSPCRVENVEPGTHFVKAEAKGFQPMADRAISVTGSSDAVLNLELTLDEKTAKAKKEGDGIASADDLFAAAPQEADDESAGESYGSKLTAATRASAPPAPASALMKKLAASSGGSPAIAQKPQKAGKGIINISADPPANIIVDGRPLGMTPKSVRVSAGAHTIVFAGPSGRKVRSVNVAGGGTSSIHAKF